MLVEQELNPMPETAEAADELDPSAADDDLLEQLVAMSAGVRRIVPSCIGLSATLCEQDLIFTLVASEAQVAQLGAARHLTQGHRSDDADTGGVVIDLMTRQRLPPPVHSDAAQRWGVASTLSLPLRDEARGATRVTLYGASPHCFDGHHEELARVLGALAGDAVVDADLPFATCAAARDAPRILRDAATVASAVATVAMTLELSVVQAQERLSDAADRASMADVEVARMVTGILARDHG